MEITGDELGVKEDTQEYDTVMLAIGRDPCTSGKFETFRIFSYSGVRLRGHSRKNWLTRTNISLETFLKGQLFAFFEHSMALRRTTLKQILQ